MPPLKILAWPKTSPSSTYFDIIYDRLDPQRFQVDDFTPARALRGRYDILHVHFPDKAVYFKSLRRTLPRLLAIGAIIALMKRRGTRLVWTVHNLESHERWHPRLERWYNAGFTRAVDCCICLNASTRGPLIERYPALAATAHAVMPHPHYRGAYPDTVTRDEARAALGLEPDAKVVLFLGQIRRYKNVPRLIEAFRRLPDPGLRLVIAGKPADPALRDEIAALAAADPRVRPHLDFVPDDRMQHFLNAADLVALPYQDILNSGAAILGLSFRRPVLVPRRGAMGDLAGIVGGQWVRLFDGELTPDELAAAVAWATAPAERDLSGLRALDPEAVARGHEEIYWRLAARRPTRRPARSWIAER